MTIDGFEARHADAMIGFRDDACMRLSAGLDRLSALFGVEVEGVEHLPAGRALLVANHAFGWDVALAAAAIRMRTGRPVFALGEHLWWKVPVLRRLACAVGVVDGTPHNVDALLEADQMVLVLPGGLREALKPSALRYRLLWGERYGFVRAALRASAPMVPLASVGADDVFDLVGDAYARGRRFHLPVPLPRIAHLPHRAKLRYLIGDPIVPLNPPEHADDRDVLRRHRWMIAGALHELLDRELARRELRS
jgi:1-acyl-sn-glycerol-3-phosphate acyltransferase